MSNSVRNSLNAINRARMKTMRGYLKDTALSKPYYGKLLDKPDTDQFDIDDLIQEERAAILKNTIVDS